MTISIKMDYNNSDNINRTYNLKFNYSYEKCIIDGGFMLGTKQIFILFINDPFFTLKKLLTLFKYPSSIMNLMRGNSEKLSLKFYLTGEELLVKYAQIVFKKNFNGKNTLNKKELKRLIYSNYHGSHPIQKALVKWNNVLYTIVKINKPQIIIETGVFWGYSSAHILQALNENNNGFLYSIDLTPERLSKYGYKSGVVVPEDLKNKWKLLIGKSENILPQLLDDLEKIDIFIHDSLHTYEHMLFEYQTAYPYLNEGGLLISHDVDKRGSAFIDFVKSKDMQYFIDDTIGVAIK